MTKPNNQGPDPEGQRASTESHVSLLEADIKLLRDQVDLLQIAANEPRTPWLRHPANIISVIALAVSVIGAVMGQLSTDDAELRSKKEELRTVLSRLIDIREDYNSRILAIPDADARELASSYSETKKNLYLETARHLAAQLKDLVNPTEHLILASEATMESDFAEAERSHQRAVAASHDDMTKHVSLRALGLFYFGNGTASGVEKGRRYLREAQKLLDGVDDSYSLYVKGFTFEQWGLYELQYGFEKEGRENIERAREAYSKMQDDYTLAVKPLDLLDDHVKRVKHIALK